MGEFERSSWSKSKPRSGTCTRGRTSPRSVAACGRAERVGEEREGASGVIEGKVGSVSRVRSEGRACSRPVMELSEERALCKREREREGGGSRCVGGGSLRASSQPRWEDRRREKRAWEEAGGGGGEGALERLSGRVVVVSKSVTGGNEGEDEASRPGAHERGRRLGRVGASVAPLECAWPIVRGHRARERWEGWPSQTADRRRGR